jgi:hypothetical protein
MATSFARSRWPNAISGYRSISSSNPVYRLRPATDGHTAFMGGVEVYNRSARSNAIRAYAFWRKNDTGKWIPMESQNCQENVMTVLQKNAPHACYHPAVFRDRGQVDGIHGKSRNREMEIRIEIEDLFGKRYRVEVKGRQAVRG